MKAGKGGRRAGPYRHHLGAGLEHLGRLANEWKPRCHAAQVVPKRARKRSQVASSRCQAKPALGATAATERRGRRPFVDMDMQLIWPWKRCDGPMPNPCLCVCSRQSALHPREAVSRAILRRGLMTGCQAALPFTEYSLLSHCVGTLLADLQRDGGVSSRGLPVSSPANDRYRTSKRPPGRPDQARTRSISPSTSSSSAVREPVRSLCRWWSPLKKGRARAQS